MSFPVLEGVQWIPDWRSTVKTRILGAFVPLLLVTVACGDDEITAPAGTTAPEGRYALAWFAQRTAPAIALIPGIPFVVDDCGNGAEAPNASFTFADSTALALQHTPQDYAVTLVGQVVDCTGTVSPYFDVVAGSYLMVDNRITLMSDLTHPHLEGTVEATSDTAQIQLRPALPGLAYPLHGIDRLCFTRLE